MPDRHASCSSGSCARKKLRPQEGWREAGEACFLCYAALQAQRFLREETRRQAHLQAFLATQAAPTQGAAASSAQGAADSEAEAAGADRGAGSGAGHNAAACTVCGTTKRCPRLCRLIACIRLASPRMVCG